MEGGVLNIMRGRSRNTVDLRTLYETRGGARWDFTDQIGVAWVGTLAPSTKPGTEHVGFLPTRQALLGGGGGVLVVVHGRWS